MKLRQRRPAEIAGAGATVEGEAPEPGVSPTPRRPWRMVEWVLRLVAGAALLIWVLSRPETRAALTELKLEVAWVVALAIVIYIGASLLQAIKWGMILAASGHRLPFLLLVRAWFIGMFASFATPTSTVGSDVVKVVLAHRAGVPGSIAALTVFVGRVTGLVAMLVIGVVGAMAAHRATDNHLRVLFAVIAALLLAVLVFGAAAVWAERRFGVADRLPPVVGKRVRQLSDGLTRLARDPRRMGWVMVLSLVIQFIMVGLNWMLGRAAGVDIAAVHWFWVNSVNTLGGMMPIGLGGVGSRDWTATTVFGMLGFEGAGAAAALLWTAMIILSSLPGAAMAAGLDLRRRSAQPPGGPVHGGDKG